MENIKKYIAQFSDLLPVVIIIIFMAAVGLTCTLPKAGSSDRAAELSAGWTADSGSTYSADDLPAGDLSVSHDLSGIDLSRKRLCFISVDTHIAVSFDGGEVSYTYAPEQEPILGKSYGMYIHTVPIPADASSVTLKLHPVYPNASASVKSIAVEDAGMFMSDIYHKGLPSLALCLLILLFGVLMLIIGFTTLRSTAGSQVNFFSLGVFAILTGVWSANDTMILQVFTQHPEIIRIIIYLCLIFIAYLPVSFMASVTGNRKTLLLPVLLSLTLINFTVTVILSLLQIADVRQMLLFSHINIAIALAMTVYLMIRAVRRKTIDRKFVHTVTVGMSAAVIGVILDMLRFRIFPDSILGASFFTRIGVLTFIILMGIHLMRERTRLAVEQGQAELMRKMAYTDGLTELANRAAFHLAEDEIRRKHTECMIIQLDINFLKKVNDVYGHAEGDKHIITAAHIIRDSFRGIGTCYRTGGDEFVVVAYACTEEAVSEALQQLEKKAAAYNAAENPPVALQIAYGYAHYKTQADMLEEAEKLADQRMYEKKKAMKGERGVSP